MLQPKLQAQQGEGGSEPKASSRSTLQAERRLQHSTHSTLNPPTCTLVHLQPVCSSVLFSYYSASVYHVHLFRVVLSGGSITALRPRFRCDDSVTSSNFNRRNLPILTSGRARAYLSPKLTFVKTDFLDDGGRNSDFLHSQPAARALSSSSRPGQSGDARRDGLCELCSPREGDVGCDPVNTLEHLGLF